DRIGQHDRAHDRARQSVFQHGHVAAQREAELVAALHAADVLVAERQAQPVELSRQVVTRLIGRVAASYYLAVGVGYGDARALQVGDLTRPAFQRDRIVVDERLNDGGVQGNRLALGLEGRGAFEIQRLDLLGPRVGLVRGLALRAFEEPRAD